MPSPTLETTMHNTDRTCWTCGGSGRVSVITKAKDLASFLESLADSFIPFYARTKTCPKCRGKGYYLTVRERLR